MRKLFLLVAVVLLTLSGCQDAPARQLRDGDIIFQTSRSSQSIAIQRATLSQYSHMGIIFFSKGKPYVYEAMNIVQYTPLKRWIARGEGGRYVVKRLRDSDRILSPEAVAKLKQAASRYEGKPYDLAFEWSDDRIYCSELVWKIYYCGLNLQIGKLQKLREFNLTDPAVRKKMRERYKNGIPLDETVISPGAMFSSESLIEATHR